MHSRYMSVGRRVVQNRGLTFNDIATPALHIIYHLHHCGHAANTYPPAHHPCSLSVPPSSGEKPSCPYQENLPLTEEASTSVTGSRLSSASASGASEDGEGKTIGRSNEPNLPPPILALTHWKLTRTARAPKPQSKPPTGAATKAP